MEKEYPAIICKCHKCGTEWSVIIAKYEFTIPCPQCGNNTDNGIRWGGLHPWPIILEGAGTNPDPTQPCCKGGHKHASNHK